MSPASSFFILVDLLSDTEVVTAQGQPLQGPFHVVAVSEVTTAYFVKTLI